MTVCETAKGEKQEIDKRTHIVTSHTVTILPYHISIILLTPINHIYNINLQMNTLLEMEENFFLSIKQPNITIIPTLQKLEGRTPDEFMAILWNPGGHIITIKSSTTISYIRVQLHRKIQN